MKYLALLALVGCADVIGIAEIEPAASCVHFRVQKVGGGLGVAAGDVLGFDGRLELAVVVNGTVAIYNATGVPSRFVLREELGLPVPGSAVQIADLNRDGQLDIAVASDAGLSSFLGTSESFSGSDVSAPGVDRGLAIGDLDGDGIPDIGLSSRSSGNNVMTFLLGRSQPTSAFAVFSEPQVRSGPPAFAGAAIAFADASGDGGLDVLLGTAQGLTLLHNITPPGGVVTLQTTPSLGISGSGSAVVAAQLDSGVTPDILVAGDRGALLAMNLGGPNAATRTVPGDGSAVDAIAIGDLDGDGANDDLVIAGDGKLQIVLTDPPPGLGQRVIVTEPLPTDAHVTAIAIADFDQDGLPDLVVAVDANTVYALFGTRRVSDTCR